ncbi:hypothetical protein FQN57_005513 [Myotisia sp. PD_48]|nr:hypothetical protein FQN57_005513 [Myotisia sp. PD_48]
MVESASRVIQDDGPSQGLNTRASRSQRQLRPGSEDSWIEVASQPSSSSLSSIATTDEIVTTGLRIQQQRRRRGLQANNIPSHALDITYPHEPGSITGSSQDENEETESESDRVMGSSNDDLRPRPRHDVTFIPGASSSSDVALSSDEDDTSTALGFNPQPNAFSHPPVSSRSLPPRGSTTYGSSRVDHRPSTRRNSRSSTHSTRRIRQQHHQQQHSPYSMISPSHQADHDAALRASLSTLLSCAAAARGLPKRGTQPSVAERSPVSRAEPSSFRLVPQPVAMRQYEEGEMHLSDQPPESTSPKRARSPLPATHHSRRKASPSKDHSKKSRRSMPTESSTTLTPMVMTWVISAGVVVLFSAISFSAGYVLGREVGRIESQGMYGLGGVAEPGNATGLSGLGSGGGCGKDAVNGGLRRFRWPSGGLASNIST